MQTQTALEMVYQADRLRWCKKIPVSDAAVKVVDCALDDKSPHTTMTFGEMQSCAEELNRLKADGYLHFRGRIAIAKNPDNQRRSISRAIRQHLAHCDRQQERRLRFNPLRPAVLSV